MATLLLRLSGPVVAAAGGEDSVGEAAGAALPFLAAALADLVAATGSSISVADASDPDGRLPNAPGLLERLWAAMGSLSCKVCKPYGLCPIKTWISNAGSSAAGVAGMRIESTCTLSLTTPLATLRFSVEFQWFLMLLSVRPGR